MNVFVSPFQNPFLNLALEDHFLRGGAELPVALFYVNRPCVVLGRFQNPWLECNLPYLVENDIWLVRRQSGGGCVFHDEGNLNFCFITPEPLIDRRRHAELLRRAFAKADIRLEISPRNDLWLEGRKISGSAFKQTKMGSFHHGTFLVKSDLKRLEESLQHTILPKDSKSIPSVRSKVISLQERFPYVEIEDVIELVAHEVGTKPMTLEPMVLSELQVQKSFQDLRGQEWLWGETPAFELENGVKVRKGKLEDGRAFGPESMRGLLNEEQLQKLFPDFSEQHRSSNLIL